MLEIKRLAESFGAQATRNAMRSYLTGKAGRHKIDDLGLARPWLEEEGEAWLAGDDLTARGRTHRISSEVASRFPGHNFESTLTRIRKKLTKHRVPAAILCSIPKVIQNWPYRDAIRKLLEVRSIAPSITPITDKLLEGILDCLVVHRALIGEPDEASSPVSLIESIGGVESSGIGAGIALREKVRDYRKLYGNRSAMDEIAHD
mgnify:FL=1